MLLPMPHVAADLRKADVDNGHSNHLNPQVPKLLWRVLFCFSILKYHKEYCQKWSGAGKVHIPEKQVLFAFFQVPILFLWMKLRRLEWKSFRCLVFPILQ